MSKQSALIFVLFCIVFTTSKDFYSLHSKSIKGKLTQMMVEVETTSPTPKTIKGILKAIKNMLDKLVKAQKKHAEIAKKMKKQCIDEKKFRAKEIEEAKDALARSSVAHEKSSKSLNESKQLYPQLKQTKKTYIIHLKAATEQRKKENKIFRQVKADYEEAINFLIKFIKYVIKRFKKDKKSSFSYSFEEIAEQVLKHSSKLNILDKAAPALVQMAQLRAHNKYDYQENSEVLTSLKDCLKKLLKALKDDLEDKVNEEKKRVKIFLELKALLEKSIDKLKRQIKKVKKQIEKMKASVAKEKHIMLKASRKLNRNDNLKKAAAKMCSKFAQEFVRATKNRLAEIKCVQKILKICRKRFGQLPRDLVKYLRKVKDDWIEYVNSTAFKKFKEYAQKHIKDNKHGKKLVNQKTIKVKETNDS